MYVDDIYLIELDDVSLTCTPASEANSTEPDGLRVDGYDNAPQVIPAGSIFATEGWIRWNVTPRHDILEIDDFGNSFPYYGQGWGDATNYINIAHGGANIVQLAFQAGGAGHQSANWAAAGAIVADTTYLFEVKWTATQMELLIDGVQRINIVQPVNFTTVPTTWYPGSRQALDRQIDAVFGAP